MSTHVHFKMILAFIGNNAVKISEDRVLYGHFAHMSVGPSHFAQMLS